MYVKFWKTVGLWDNLTKLIRVAGWKEFLSLTLPVYERLCVGNFFEFPCCRLECPFSVALYLY